MHEEVNVTIGEKELIEMFAKHIGIEPEDIKFWYVSSIIKHNAKITYRKRS